MSIDLVQMVLNVPYNQKDEAKKRGAQWEVEQKTWYVPHGLNIHDFVEWWPAEMVLAWADVLKKNEQLRTPEPEPEPQVGGTWGEPNQGTLHTITDLKTGITYNVDELPPNHGFNIIPTEEMFFRLFGPLTVVDFTAEPTRSRKRKAKTTPP